MRPIDADNTIKKLDCLFKETDVKSLNFMTIGYNHAVADSIAVIKGQPTADVTDMKVGKWTEKEVIHAEEAKNVIEEWQSCRCSVCGRYHTEPYMYYFNEPRFCSWCGADMRQDDPSHPFVDDVMMKGEADDEAD